MMSTGRVSLRRSQTSGSSRISASTPSSGDLIRSFRRKPSFGRVFMLRVGPVAAVVHTGAPTVRGSVGVRGGPWVAGVGVDRLPQGSTVGPRGRRRAVGGGRSAWMSHLFPPIFMALLSGGARLYRMSRCRRFAVPAIISPVVCSILSRRISASAPSSGDLIRSFRRKPSFGRVFMLRLRVCQCRRMTWWGRGSPSVLVPFWRWQAFSESSKTMAVSGAFCCRARFAKTARCSRCRFVASITAMRRASSRFLAMYPITSNAARVVRLDRSSSPTTARYRSDERISDFRKCFRANVVFPEPEGPISTTSPKSGMVICCIW